jgi:hypothetical protein
VPDVDVDISLAAATEEAPETSKRAFGAVVPIPTFPLPFMIIASEPPVLNRTELLNLEEFVVFIPIRSIQLFAGVCADNRKNPLSSDGITPLISFVVDDVVMDGISKFL